MERQTFSLVRAVPGMRPGSTARNLSLALLAPALVLIWPFVAAYAVGINRGGIADALTAIPGITRGGDNLSAVAAFTWTTLALVVVIAPLAATAPALVGLWLTLTLPALYLLGVGYGATQSVRLFGDWWELRGIESTGPEAVSPGPVQFTGAARSTGETVETPFSKTPAVAHVSGRYRYTADADPGTLDSSTWALTDRYEESVPFEIGDSTSVLVDATDATVTLESSRGSIQNDDTGTPTERLPDTVDSDPETALPGEPRGPTGFVEQRIEPGEEVSVSGVAVPAEENRDHGDAHEFVVTSAEHAPTAYVGENELELVITDDRSNAAASDLFRRGLSLLVLTLLLVVPLALSPLPAWLLGLLGF